MGKGKEGEDVWSEVELQEGTMRRVSFLQGIMGRVSLLHLEKSQGATATAEIRALPLKELYLALQGTWKLLASGGKS